MDSIDLVFIVLRFLGRFFAIGLRIRRVGNSVVASSNFTSQLLCLGFGGRRVTVDPGLKTVRIYYRTFWFVPKWRTIAFARVQQVNYGYADVGTGYGAYQEGDLFTVGLRLKDGKDITLFRYCGQGAFVNYSIWPDWMLWPEYKISELTAGPQEDQSALFADLVSKLIGVPLENPGYIG